MVAPEPQQGRPFRFPRGRRLTLAAQYRQVFAHATPFRNTGFVVLARANAANGPRLGLVIAKRHCPDASDRNRLKRIARESFRTHRDDLPAVDVVVLATARTRLFQNNDLFRALERSWHLISRHSWADS